MKLSMRRSNTKRPLYQSSISGNLYYVRLKTPVGIFYKIGFTTLGSVEARMNYGGSNDASYIDKVLMFVNSSEAYDIEQQLHSCLCNKAAFEKYSSNDNFPLSKNGQTELYIEDILDLDPNYTDDQKYETLKKLKEKKIILSGKTAEQYNFEKKSLNILIKILAIVFFPIAIIMVLFFDFINGKNSKQEVADIFDRVFNGGRKEKARKEAKVKENVSKIMSKLSFV